MSLVQGVKQSGFKGWDLSTLLSMVIKAPLHGVAITAPCTFKVGQK